MRIGIITLPLHTNYGGILQAYALQRILRQWGYDVETIDKPHRYNIPFWKLMLLIPLRAYKKYVRKEKEGIFKEWVHNKYYPIISRYTEQFISNNINRHECENFPIVREGQYDCLIVGSDQVWRRKYHKSIASVYLDFARDWNIKRIAYAVSFGSDRWEYSDEDTCACKHLIAAFDAVSVREISGINLCRQYLGIDATHVLDPTMLLEKENYINLFQQKNTGKSEGDLLCYILDSSKESNELIKYLESSLDMTAFSVISKKSDSYKGKDNVQPSVEKWLRGFYDAELVITDSFHACVFSILFNKPFVVIENESRGIARIESLLQEFGIPNRFVRDKKQILNIAKEPIDYEKVNMILKERKQDSLNFLKKHLTSFNHG